MLPKLIANIIRKELPKLSSKPNHVIRFIRSNQNKRLNGQPKRLHPNFRKYNTRLPKTPDLIYIPHVMRWLKTKFQFKYLQKKWDPDFTEGAFIYGSTKAVCRITEIIADDKPEQLDELLTTAARIKLELDMRTRLTKGQRAIIRLKPEDIKILVPMTVSMSSDERQKDCKVLMRVLALKWIQQPNGALRLVLVALQTEFLRNYNEGASQDWTISAFDIMECAVLSQAPH
ncbi:unnamed protein product [Acanthoscelides obtectus]|uniref:Uncharacterized protein n=2 Tax=Acanthoscelides obtectus TaxID=200917 RepID=A0A9P0K9E3_ACAOB|nr:unnamed protein product [Acanthoscelides obtectus]CAK1658192.1 hypothetical protein AOBTE_LOCUS20758 [Acanthoscelides obtectus]